MSFAQTATVVSLVQVVVKAPAIAIVRVTDQCIGLALVAKSLELVAFVPSRSVAEGCKELAQVTLVAASVTELG